MPLQALEKCQLKRTIRSLPNLFDSSVSDEGENWSVGQRQLFSTDDILQEIIREEFSSCAVITVAHRVPTVIDSDKVMVLSFVFHEKSKHFKIDVHFVREKVAAGVIKTVKVSWLSVKIKLIDLVFFSECLSDSVVRLDSDPPSGDQSLPSSGVKLLGGVVIRDADFISGLAMRRVANAVDLMGLLPQLHDPQTSRAQSWVLQDHILRDSGICGMDDDYVSALACDAVVIGL
ncbi:ABC transporter C family member 8-like protein isoform X1 [Tanacetum coccineum]